MSLRELCIDEIAASMNRYYHLYSTTVNEELQRRFHFLQRVYSQELASRLTHKDLLQEEYAVFVFNKYLRSIDEKWFAKLSWQTVRETFARIGPNLETVHFNGHFSDQVPWEDVVSYLPNVKAITYTSYCHDGILRCIAKYCPKLERLDVTHSVHVTDDGLRYFCGMKKKKRTWMDHKDEVPCTQLKEIFVTRTSVYGESVEQLLEHLPSLEKIVYEVLPFALLKLHENNLRSSVKVKKYNLTYLDLLYINVRFFDRIDEYDDILKACITVCPKLRSLKCWIYKPEHLNLCSMLPYVEDLHLMLYFSSFSEEDRVNVSDFLKEKGGKITIVEFVGCIFSFSAFGECLRIEELEMHEVSIHCNESDSIPTFFNLRTFTVGDVDFSSSGNCVGIRRILRSSPVLEVLGLDWGDSFPTEMKAEILKCCEQFSLKVIKFQGSPVEEDFLKSIIVTCSSLEAFHLYCNTSAELKEDLYRTAESVSNKPKILIEKYK